jgi:hypothetical protein
MCEVCKRKGLVFTVEIEGKKSKACSNCIMKNHFTGWSK